MVTDGYPSAPPQADVGEREGEAAGRDSAEDERGPQSPWDGAADGEDVAGTELEVTTGGSDPRENGPYRVDLHR